MPVQTSRLHCICSFEMTHRHGPGVIRRRRMQVLQNACVRCVHQCYNSPFILFEIVSEGIALPFSSRELFHHPDKGREHLEQVPWLSPSAACTHKSIGELYERSVCRF